MEKVVKQVLSLCIFVVNIIDSEDVVDIGRFRDYFAFIQLQVTV